MATYKDPRDGRWRYRFSFRNRRYKGSSPKEANKQSVAAKLERQHLDRLVAQRWDGDMPTVAGFIVTFLDYQMARVKPLTYELQERHLKKHVGPHLGKKTIERVGVAEIDSLVTAWKQSAAPRTINTRLGTLLRMLGLAHEWGMLQSVPKATFLKIPKDTPRFLSEPEAVALLEAAKAPRRVDALDWHVMILIGLRTGLRIGELRGLQWADVDLVRGAVHVRRTDPGRADVESTSPKGGRERVIPLTPDALACLRVWCESEKQRLGEDWSLEMWVWPGAAIWRAHKDRKRTRSEGNCKTAICRYAKRAGLKDVGWHTLRHTFASWLVMRGVPLIVVQQLLGHASIRQTERYAHLAPGFINHGVVASLDLPLHQPVLPSGEKDERP